MKTHSRSGSRGFTLIEMMSVITIIVILAVLVIGSMGWVTDRQAKEKARVQIGLLSMALEKYKLDNSVYPPTADSAKGLGNSGILFKALYFDGANDASGTKTVYLPELDPNANKGWTSGIASDMTKIVDPWGTEYRYRSALSATSTANPSTQNPEFDLWSSGKDGDTNPTTPGDKLNRDDIKNF